MKDIRIFVASSCEMVAERNALAYFAIAHEDEFVGRGLRVRLSKWEYVDPTMASGLKEDEYLKELRDSDGALILFQKVLGKFTRQEYDEALEYEKTGCRLQAHQILFKEGPGIEPSPELAAWRAELPAEGYRCFSDMAGLEAEFLALVNRLAGMRLCDAPSDAHVQRVTAFLVADDELAADRDAFADAILNFNDILAYRNLRVKMQFCSPGLGTAECHQIAAASEMMLVLYGRKIGVFGRDEVRRVYKRTCENANPKRLYVFFRTEDEKELPPEFRAFRDSFVEDLGHFVCHYGVSDTLRLNFVMSLERYVGEQCEQQKKEIFSTVETPTATKFVGREAELVRLHQLLKILPEFPTGRLPVVLGPGGSGKSELIRAYASQFRFKYPGGVFQVDMEKVSDWDGAFRGLLDRTSNTGVRVADYLGLGKDDARGEEGAEGRGPRTYSAAQIREALLKTARQKGPVLVVLDNVEDCRTLLGDDGRFCKAFPVGVSERVQVNVVATARVCDVPQNGDGWAVELPLEDLSPEAARELILSVHSAKDKRETAAVDEIAKLLGYRALFLRRIPALVEDDDSELMCDTYSELRNALRESLLGTVSAGFETLWKDDEDHLPGELWKFTCKHLSKNKLEAECIKLAQVASFFSPDGFALHILKHLWKTIVASPDHVDKFDRALRILQRHNIFQSVDPVRIHRLDRAAILQTAKAEVGFEDSLGAALADYGLLTKSDWVSLYEFEGVRRHLPWALAHDGEFWATLLHSHPQFEGESHWLSFSGHDWVSLLCARPKFARYCLWEKLNGSGWCKLLRYQPQFANHCSWEKLDGADWCGLLQCQPQFANHCSWARLDGTNWRELLRYQPQFADHCAWKKLDEWDWFCLLRYQPHFVSICPFKLSCSEQIFQLQVTEQCAADELSGRDWASLLRVQPQFVNRCEWHKLDGKNWVRLLCDQPQYADRCEWKKLDGKDWTSLLCDRPQFADRCEWKKLDGWNWVSLLCDQPQFADRCEWMKLDGRGWATLLCVRTQFSERCEWKKLDGKDWATLLSVQPKFIDHCKWGKLDGEDWVSLLRAQPQFVGRCMWEKLDRRDWFYLLRDYPQFAKYCTWKNLSNEDWVDILLCQPQFMDRCSWGALDGESWCALLCAQPQLADRCLWERLDGHNWSVLLCAKPQFERNCSWNKLDGRDWCRLLKTQPQFAIRCPWEKMDNTDMSCLLREQPQFAIHCAWECLSGCDWSLILSAQPQFANRCVWDELNGRDWCLLLCAQPQFEGRCPWAKLRGNDWVELLRAQPKFVNHCMWDKLSGTHWCDLLCRDPHFAEYCPWEKLDDESRRMLLSFHPKFAGRLPRDKFDVSDWITLMCVRPHLADGCPWERIDGGGWCKILCVQPQFGNRCSWEKLEGGDWAELLGAQPQFADHCTWAKLSGSDWVSLLRVQPQFADHCAWGMLNGSEWVSLLCAQPQFEEHCQWEKIDGFDWYRLLLEQSHFSNCCAWEKLDGTHWALLLQSIPQLAGQCAWEKLNGRDWSALLCLRPEFADRCVWESLEDDDWEMLLCQQPQLAKWRKGKHP